MTPLLLIPGMMCDARLFGPQVAMASARRDVMVSTITGHDTVEALATAILHNAPPRFALAGLSMGGIIAMEVLRQAPERVERLALLDTNPLAETDAVKAKRAPQMQAVQEGKLATLMSETIMPNYIADGSDPGILDLCLEMALSVGPETFLNQSRALRDRPDQTETLRAYAGPALVLCGREDKLCPVHRHDLMAELMPQATLTVFDGVGHISTLEAPELTNEALRLWLEA